MIEIASRCSSNRYLFNVSHLIRKRLLWRIPCFCRSKCQDPPDENWCGRSLAGQIHKSRPQVASVLLRAGKTIFQSDSSNFSVGLRKLCKMGLLSVSVSSSPSASWPLRMSHLSAVAMASRNSRLMVNLSLPEYLLSDCPRPAMARQFRAVRRLQSPAAGRPPWQSFHRASPRPPFASLAQRPRAGGR